MTKEQLPIGFTLNQVLKGHSETINRLEFSPDGQLLASASFDGSIALWDVLSGQLRQRLQSPAGYPRALQWSLDSQRLAVGCNDNTIQLWHCQGELEAVIPGHNGRVNSVAWSPDSQLLASASDDRSVMIWSCADWHCIQVLRGHSRSVNTVVFSPSGHLLASGGDDKLIRLWQPESGHLQQTLKGHAGMICSLAFSPRQPQLVSASSDKTIGIWDLTSGRQLRILEGHTDVVYKIAFSSDGQLLASKSDDNTILLWQGDASTPLVTLEEPTDQQVWLGGLAFHPQQPLLATLGNSDRIIRLWQLDVEKILNNQPNKHSIFSGLLAKLRQLGTPKTTGEPEASIQHNPHMTPTVHYTTAKIALVGDSGVGKTGLGWRLAHGHFKEHASTHGQQFWIIDALKATRADGTECEAVLWDFAGQPDYRLIHALFLDDIDLALVLFDPTHQQEPLKGVEYWLKQLQYNQDAACQTILVGARVDRGSPSLTQEELQSFCQRHHISQGYLLTSALTNEGLTELMSRVRQALQWELMPATITTLTFRRIKEFVLTLKEDTSGHKVLWRPTELRARLERIDPNWQFNDAELLTALQHLSNHGYVSLLRTSAGERMVLLMPDMLTNLASSLVLEARRNEKGLGALEENRILHGDYPLPELNRLGLKDRETLLDATLALFLERTLCFRESVNGQSFLVFPALINQKRPATDDFETIDDISYIVSGAIENLYAALVVLLGYTNTFTRVHQWQNQAIYEMGTGQLCGFRKVEEREGELELVLFYSSNTQEATKILFKSLFERFLQGREVSMTAYPPITCSICGYLQERSEVTKRLQAEKAFMFCGECGGKVSLIPQPTEEILAPQERQTLEQEQTSAQGRAEFAKALVWVKGYLRDHHPEFKPPVCFISYAWGVGEHERWVKNLAEDMLDAGLDIILDDWDNSMFGSSVSRFISRIESCDFIVVVATPLFLDKYINKVSATGSVVAAEVDLIQQRLLGTEEDKNTVIPLLLDGEDRNALPPLLRGRAYGDFREQHFYFARLFDLILTLYRINFRDPAVRDLRDELRTEAQRN